MEGEPLGAYDYPEKYWVGSRYLVHCWYPAVAGSTSSSQSFLLEDVDVTTAMAWAAKEAGSTNFELFVEHVGDWIALYQRLPANITDSPST